MNTFFRISAGLTLLVDTYLLLALIATSRMKAEYHHWLPPFGYEFASAYRWVFICVMIWTALLAVGCLYLGRRRAHTEK